MDKALGTAAWADPFDVADHHEYDKGALWLGRSPLDDDTPIGFADDRHVCLVSGSRGGKGTTFIVNNLAHWPGSLVVIDPKGENATVTAARRGPGSKYCKGLGQDVHVLDPFNAAKVPQDLRSRFNPLDILDPSREETIDEAGRIADALVVSNPESKDPFWDESARAMIKVLILYVLTTPEFSERRNLLMIRDLITRGDVEKVEILKACGDTDVPSAHSLLWEGVRGNEEFGGVIARIGSSFASMLESSPKQYESVRQVADRNTEFIDSPGMQRCLESSSFRLSDLKTNPAGVSLYLSLPQRYMNTHFRWLRMMIALTLTEMEATPGRPASGHRVLFCLDEFAGLKRMEIIENAVAQIAGYGVKMLFVLQTLEQLKGTYKEKWETFLSNCGLKIFFGLEDYFSREYVSKFIGEMEVVRTSRNASENTSTQEGISKTTGSSSSVSRSEQISSSVSTSYTKSKGTSTSKTRGTNRGRSGGSNWGLNLGHNSSSGSNWKPQLFFGREDEKESDSSGWSQGGSYGRNSGWSEGDNTSETKGTTTGESIGSSKSFTRSIGESVSESTNKSETISSGRAEGSSHGVSESVHKRRLITEDEIGLVFQRQTNKKHLAYPGFALVLAAGEPPIFVRKANYFDDPLFIDCYDPHPDHPFLPLVKHSFDLNGPLPELLTALNQHASSPFRIAKSLVSEGLKIKTGDVLFEVEGEAYGARKAAIRAPLNGSITSVQAGEGRTLASDLLCAITYYGEAQSAENPLKELEALLPVIAADRAKALQPKPVEKPLDRAVAPRPVKKEGNFNGIALVLATVLGLILVFVFASDRQSTTGPVEQTAPARASETSSSTTPKKPFDIFEVHNTIGVFDWEKHRAIYNQESVCVTDLSGQHFAYQNGYLEKYIHYPDRQLLLVFRSSNPTDTCLLKPSVSWRYSPRARILQVNKLGQRVWENLKPILDPRTVEWNPNYAQGAKLSLPAHQKRRMGGR